MNHHATPSIRRRRARLIAAVPALAALLALSACGGQSDAASSTEPPLAGADIGGEFELIDTAGKTVRWGDFTGRYRVVYFGFAYCPDICPNDMSQLARGLETLKTSAPAKAARVQPIFITVDPERDTPEVVGQFTAAFSDDFIGLTGTPEQVRAAADTFRVYYERGEDLDGGQYLMNHSNIAYLFGPAGEPLATLPTDEGAEAVAAELDRWVK